MDTNELVHSLCQKYRTRDPFELADSMKIIVLFEELGSIHGYYNQCFRQQFIHINAHDVREKQRFTCAHELGHAVLHPSANTPFLREKTLFSINKLEVQANRFAIDLVYDDYDLIELLDRPITDAAQRMGVSIPLAEYRMKSVESRLFSEY